MLPIIYSADTSFPQSTVVEDKHNGKRLEANLSVFAKSHY